MTATTDEPINADVRRVRAEITDGGLVPMALGMRGPDETTMGLVTSDLQLADELGLRTSMHVDGLDCQKSREFPPGDRGNSSSVGRAAMSTGALRCRA